ncbi:MAG: winged helix DNA-binding domain-containing protein [Acidimicrobiales bacterium]
MTATTPILSRRALNRATLERQLLLRRSPMGVTEAVAHLVGLQAQVPVDPYTALWSRLDGFAPDDLGGLVTDRSVVRTVLMRGTIHLVTAADCLELRAHFQPVLDKELARHPDYGPALAGIDLAPVLEASRPLLAEPRTPARLRAALAERFPELDAGALAYACRNHLALVQAPPRGVWGRTGQVAWVDAEAWLGGPVATAPSIDRLVLRYLAAFGPASVADVATWSRLTGLREVIDRLSPGLRRFRDERRRDLVDLPDAPRPDPDTPAPVRFLPEYDNLLLSHDDRSRFYDRSVSSDGPVRGTVLHDGVVRGIWRVERASRRLVVEHAGPATDEIVAEAEALAAMWGAGEVRLMPG